MRHPSELFILSLLVDGKTNEDVSGLLEEYGLPALLDTQDAYIADLRVRISKEKPRGFTGARPQDRSFLRTLNIDGLYHPDSLVASATALGQQPAVRKDLALGLIGRVDLVDLARHLSRKYDLDLDVHALKIYKHYYFNIDLVSYGDWPLFFENEGNEEETVLMTTCLDGGPIVAAHRIGLERNVTIKDAVNEVVDNLYVTLHEIKHWPASTAKIKMLSDTMSALARAHNIVNTSDQELAAIASELKKFKLAKHVDKPKPLALLSKKASDD